METAFILVVIFTIIAVGEARWCTQTKSEQIVEQLTEIHKCNQTYEASCSFFGWETCTYHELVDCPVKKNKTITRYFTVKRCCPGYKLNPINNVTCISTKAPKGDQGRKPEVTLPTEKAYNSGVSSPRIKPIVSETETESETLVGSTPSGYQMDEQARADHVSVNEDNLLLGLSHGAYAGIVCTMLFLFCVFILIMVHIRKKSMKAKAKENKPNVVEMETTEKMLTTQA